MHCEVIFTRFSQQHFLVSFSAIQLKEISEFRISYFAPGLFLPSISTPWVIYSSEGL